MNDYGRNASGICTQCRADESETHEKTCSFGKLIRASAPAATGTEAAVCADIAARQALGIAKYGTTVAQNPLELRQWLNHQYEELLDAAVYCKRAIEEIDKQKLAEAQG